MSETRRLGKEATVRKLLGEMTLLAHLPDDVSTDTRRATRPQTPLPAGPMTADYLRGDMVCWPLKRSWLGGARFSIGRDPGNDVVIPQPTLSKIHARITLQGDHVLLEDQQSANGTWLRGQKLDDKPEKLRDGDVFRLGEMELCLWDAQRLVDRLLKL